MRITLVCWHCQKEIYVEVDNLPQFGFELVGIANQSGWHGAFDTRRWRALVFCCKEHAEAEKTKKGVFRAWPIGVKANISVGA